MPSKKAVKERIEKVCTMLEGRVLLFLFSEENIFYFSGARIPPSERLAALLLFSNGSSAIICPGFEGERMRAESHADEILTWEEEEDPYKALEERIRKEIPGGGTIGLEGRVWFEVFEKMKNRLHGFTFDNATSLIDSCRMIKGDEELASMEKACEYVLGGIAAALKRFKVGMTETELGDWIAREIGFLGGKHGGALVQSGPNASFPHNPTGRRKIMEGDAVVIDSGCQVDGYFADLTRTVYIGDVPEEVRKCYRIVGEAQLAAIEKVAPGISAQDLDRTARKVIADEGYGEYFSHRLGHGIGLRGHERPYLVEGNALLLEEGMSFTVEPGIYVPGKFGIRLEDDVVVTRDGKRLLSPPVKDFSGWTVKV